MDKKLEGAFSIGFFNLQLQLQRLLEDAGGERVIKLLDQLSDLELGQRHAVLDCFIKVLERISPATPNAAAVNGSEALLTPADTATLLRSAIAALGGHDNDNPHFLELLQGGRDVIPASKDNAPIDLAQVRLARKATPPKPSLN